MTNLDHIGAVVLNTVADTAVRTLIVAALAAASVVVWRRASTATRSLIWTAVLCASLALPALVAALPARVVTPPSIPLVSAALSGIAPGGAVRARAQALFGPVVSTSGSSSSARPVATAAINAPRQITWFGGIFLAYLTGALYLAGRLGRAWIIARRLRNGVPIEAPPVLASLEIHAHHLGLARVPRLIEQPGVAVPMTTGIMRPVIALPADWRSWPHEVMRAVLVHELSHVARRDALTQTLSRVNRALAWMNPLSWWLHRQLADLAEEASDDAALEAGVSQTTYAEALLTFAGRLPVLAREPQWAVAMARKSGVATERRIDRVLAWRSTSSDREGVRARVVMALVAGIVVLVAASVRVDARHPMSSMSFTSLPVSQALAAPNGVATISLPASSSTPIGHISPAIERPWRRAPASVREAMPSAPAITLPPTSFEQSAPTPIREGFGAGAYRGGGRGIANPVLVRQVDAQYTPAAAAAKIEGDVELEAVILTDGTVGDVRAKSLTQRNPMSAADTAAAEAAQQWTFRPAGDVYGLTDAAVRAARQWTFKPARLRDEPVPMVVTLLVEFRLAKAKEANSGPGDSAYYYREMQAPLQDEFAEGAYWIGTQGLVAPTIVASVLPKYTSDALRDKLQGDVQVELIVMPDGSVGKARIAVSLDPVEGLDDNALAAARQYRFTPGTLSGRPVPVLVTIALNFRIH